MKSTKELARELGFLRMRNTDSQKVKPNSAQMFAFFIVLDFESTCWADQKTRPQEIIEFPAVMFETSSGDIKSEFQFYVQPMENCILSDFCKELTGISQNNVDNGIPLNLCVSRFKKWLKNLQTEHNIIFNGAPGSENNCTFITWSDWDLGVCLRYECRRKQIRIPPELNDWVDLRAVYKNFYNRKPQGLNGALQGLGINFVGRQHSGLDDAKNTAKLAWRMIKDGCSIAITKTMRSGELKKILFSVNTPNEGVKSVKRKSLSPKSPNVQNDKKRQAVSTSPNSFKSQNVDDKKDFYITPKSFFGKTNRNKNNFSSSPKSFKNQSNNKSYISSLPTPPKAQCDGTKNVLPSMPKSSGEDSCYSSVSPLRNQNKNTNNQNLKTEPSSANLITARRPSVSRFDKENIPAPKQLPATFQNQVKHSVQLSNTLSRNSLSISYQSTTPINQSTSINRSTPINKSLTINRSANATLNSSGYGSLKSTPPLCSCGRRASCKTVQKPGPNLGRTFFCCARGAKNVRCEFFKWCSSPSNSSLNPILSNSINYSKLDVSGRKFPANKTLGLRLR